MRKSIFVSLIALVALYSCAVEPVEGNKTGKMFNLSLHASYEQSKIEIGSLKNGSFPVLWSDDTETVRLVEVLDESGVGNDVISSSCSLSQDRTEATFEVSMEEMGADIYDYLIFNPASAVEEVNSSEVKLNFKKEQTPLTSSIQADAAVILSSFRTYEQISGTVDSHFSHLSAFARMTVKNLALGSGETLSWITVTAPGKVMSGSFIFDINDLDSYYADKCYDEVKINTENLDFSTPCDVWFTCRPFTLNAGDQLAIVVKTNKTVYSKVITLSKTVDFKAGETASFSVDMSDKVRFKVSNKNIEAYDAIDYCKARGYMTTQTCKLIGQNVKFEGFVNLEKIIPHAWFEPTSDPMVYKFRGTALNKLKNQSNNDPGGYQVFYNPDTKLMAVFPVRYKAPLNTTESGALNVIWHHGRIGANAHEHYGDLSGSFQAFANDLCFFPSGLDLTEVDPANAIPMTKTAEGVFEDYIYCLAGADAVSTNSNCWRFRTSNWNSTSAQINLEGYTFTCSDGRMKLNSGANPSVADNANWKSFPARLYHVVIDTNEKAITLTVVD